MFYKKPIRWRHFCRNRNYIHLFQNNTFLLALKNTSIFTVVAIPLLMVISFLIALFLNSFKKISSFFRSALLIPVVVPVASLICVWQVVFDDYGAINGILNFFGFNTIEFFNSEFSMVDDNFYLHLEILRILCDFVYGRTCKCSAVAL